MQTTNFVTVDVPSQRFIIFPHAYKEFSKFIKKINHTTPTHLFSTSGFRPMESAVKHRLLPVVSIPANNRDKVIFSDE